MKRIPQFLAMEAESHLKYLCALQYNLPPPRSKLSKIICTIGPSSNSLEMMERLMEQGMNIARMNFSHGSHEYHSQTVQTVRQATCNFSKKLGFDYPVSIALDTKGPEIRTGLIEGQATGEVNLNTGDAIKLTTNKQFQDKCTKDLIYVDYVNISKVVKPGDRIFIDDGLLSLSIEKVEGEDIHCNVDNGGKLGSKKGVNLPGVAVDLPSVSEKDISDLRFGVEQNVDIIFASFIRSAQALSDIREILGKAGEHIKIISKIENDEGVKNIDEIIEASDGIMVARGDLGIEIPVEKVFVAQKTIIARCNRVGKPVICATQMLESMTKKPRPTRAEISDVANAILDGADCVMLSGETAKGDYPIECLQIMSNICKEAESIIRYRELYNDLVNTSSEACMDCQHAMAIAAVQIASKINATSIVVVSQTGESAFFVSKYRPQCPIILITDCEIIARHGSLLRGVFAFSCNKSSTTLSERIDFGLQCAKKLNLISCSEQFVVFIPPKTESNYKPQISINTFAESPIE